LREKGDLEEQRRTREKASLGFMARRKIEARNWIIEA